MSTLRVRNLAQKILWEEELCGQISDGHWENASPNDHYYPWCSADVVVDPDHPGRDFYANKTAYRFDDPALLEVVGDRMLAYVQASIPDYTEDDMRRDLKDLRKVIKVEVSPRQPVPPQPTPADIQKVEWQSVKVYEVPTYWRRTDGFRELQPQPKAAKPRVKRAKAAVAAASNQPGTLVRVTGWVRVHTTDPTEAEQVVNAVAISHFMASELTIEAVFETPDLGALGSL